MAGSKYYAEVSNGVASITTAALTAGNKAVTYRYLGNDKYTSISALLL